MCRCFPEPKARIRARRGMSGNIQDKQHKECGASVCLILCLGDLPHISNY